MQEEIPAVAVGTAHPQGLAGGKRPVQPPAGGAASDLNPLVQRGDLHGSQINGIDIRDDHTLVRLPAEIPDHVLRHLADIIVRGRPLAIQRVMAHKGHGKAPGKGPGKGAGKGLRHHD